ncbi:histidinol-phosphate transaminase [Pelotomaculum terephthalicicum JT]|uniref:histidinol-phosphate transaminase n=1 Tax=Pelotomaculum terephthalicicum TaxID=206393 RepID=UPI0009D340D2|nr:histidinol-phosphate transaminase [Pelotomaculum terephthalicicum]MCG9967824.1 histidinol-phosphate transaminase [Pelotomaculum terephthalicicum JT]OPY62359.1 MAG: Histidinol-phosphate aminotransferase 2 [Pelotomaculum sp. PtaU1.Bin065]
MGSIFAINTLARDDLKVLIPYDAPAYPNMIRLADNENPFDFPVEVKNKIFQTIVPQDFNRYPDTNAFKLREKLSSYTGVAPENIMVGNGSDELILTVMLAFGAGAAFAVATPTFSMYGIHGRIALSRELKVPRLEDFSLDVKSLIRAAAKPEVKIVVICNPNSPTGNAAPLDVIEEILVNTNAVVVVDEAYGEFGGETGAPLLKNYPNLVILRTFSKALSMAGMRVGYLLARGPVMTELLKTKPPYNVNSFSQAAARAVLDNMPLFQERVKRILAEREHLFSALAGLPGIEVFPTETNFILFRTVLPSKMVYDGLLERGVLIRYLDDPALSRCLRVTVGTERENGVFLKALGDILKT